MDEVQAELKVRRRLENIFNKQPDEFECKMAYDDYLETREEYIFNLAQSIDVMATEGKIAEYQRMNHENIIMNRSRQMNAGRQGLAPDAFITTSASAAASIVVAQEGRSAADGGGASYVPSTAMAGVSASSALPVPMHKEYSEDADGCLVLAPSRRAPPCSRTHEENEGTGKWWLLRVGGIRRLV